VRRVEYERLQQGDAQSYIHVLTYLSLSLYIYIYIYILHIYIYIYIQDALSVIKCDGGVRRIENERFQK